MTYLNPQARVHSSSNQYYLFVKYVNDLKVTLSQRIKSNLDFYNKTTKQYNELSHIIDIARLENMDLAAYICTYHGSQNVGLILKKSTLELPTSLLLLIKDKIPAIMTNTLGNYILQDIMKEIAINTEIRLFVLSAICPSFVQIANDSSGTHCIQSLLRKTNDKQEIMILTNLIMFNFENLCFNNKSSHVVKKIIESIDEDLREDLNILFVNEITRLSVDPSGVCTVRKIKFRQSIS